MVRIAVLDDYQHVALEMADWSKLAGRAEVEVFHDHIDGVDELVARLAPFDVVCVMRERTPLPRAVLERLPRLALIASTGAGTLRLTSPRRPNVASKSCTPATRPLRPSS